ncbi:MAG: tetratricopeptide repeat protein [Pseudomonadota bacterium]
MTQDRGGRGRLLLVHWPAADWAWLTPVIEAGDMPTLERLRGDGAWSAMSTVNPQTASLQATALATGQRAARHGMLHPVRLADDDQIRFRTAADRTAPALWSHADAAGLKSIVVGWGGTGMAERLDHGVMVGDAALTATGNGDLPEPAPTPTVLPDAERESLEHLRLRPTDLPPGIVSDLIPNVAQMPATNEAPAFLMHHLARMTSAHLMATDLMRRWQWDFAAVEYDLFSRLAPVFMAFHPPRMGHIAASEFEMFRHVMVHVAGLLDGMLATLMEEAGPDTTVVLASTHGLTVKDQRPTSKPTVMRAQAGDWCTERGLVLMHGPAIKAAEPLYSPSALDIAPTVLALLGLPVPQDLDGRVLGEALRSISPKRGASFAGLPHTVPAGAAKDVGLTKRLLADALADGHVLVGDGEEPLQKTKAQIAYAEALAMLEGGAPAAARSTLEDRVKDAPDDRRARLHLVRCLHLLGDMEGAQAAAKPLMSEDHPVARAEVMMASQSLTQQDADAALVHLFRAEQDNPDTPRIHIEIGRIYLALDRRDEARRAFGRAEHLDPELGLARLGLALLDERDGQTVEAAEGALEALRRDATLGEAHALLGRRLRQDNKSEEAIVAYRQAARFMPKAQSVRYALYELLNDAGEKDEARGHLNAFIALQTGESVSL